MSDYITTSEAAAVIGCNDSRVRQLCRAGTVTGRRVGRDWLVERASAEHYRDHRPAAGRKPAEGGSAAGGRVRQKSRKK